MQVILYHKLFNNSLSRTIYQVQQIYTYKLLNLFIYKSFFIDLPAIQRKMGNSPTLTKQFIHNSGVKPQQWIQIRTLNQTFYRNVKMGEEYELKRVLMSLEGKFIIKQRAQIVFPHFPRIIFVNQQENTIDYLVQRGKMNIKEFLTRFKKSCRELIKYYEDIMKEFSHLRNKFGCFFITDEMIQINYNGKILVWIHEDQLQMKPQYPLPQLSGQQAMIWRINKIFESTQQLIKIKGQSFRQVLLQIQKTSKATTHLKSSQSVEYSEGQYDKNTILSSSSFLFVNKDQNTGNNLASVRKTWNNYHQIPQFFSMEIMSFPQLQSKSFLISSTSNGQQSKIGSIIKNKCKQSQTEFQRKSMNEKHQLKKQDAEDNIQISKEEQIYRQNRGRSKSCFSNHNQDHIQSHFNPFIYGNNQQQCNSPLQRQLTLELKRVFSQ